MRRINANYMAVDVHSGMDDFELMAKHELSAKRLQVLPSKLAEALLIARMQFYERTSLSDTELNRAFVYSERAFRDLNQQFEDEPRIPPAGCQCPKDSPSEEIPRTIQIFNNYCFASGPG